MYLKSIDIVGYKSFANKTHLDLEPGITGIIGPNGCGKSNVMEAVRWCLGEMSWKSLRADSMVNVIFSGTAKRAALSMAEVTLTFDNSSSMLAVQFTEVTVTRRLFRSGESAYFLNKTQCRLRDIREMFLDTGLGGDGYAIIDQGGVDAMITAKPEERRAFFEEAAGVAKYNAKREEALRKLDRVEMDMGRLQDSLSLINEQVRKLDSDARKAKLYQKYKEELAAMEAAHLLKEADRLDGELKTLSAEVAPLEEDLGAKKVEMDGEGALHAAHSLEKANQQNQVIAVNQRISEAKSEMGRLEERARSAEAGAADCDVRTAASAAEAESVEQRISAIAPELEKSSAAVAEAETARAVAETEAQSWEGQMETLSGRLSDAEAALETLRRAALSAAEEALSRRRKLSETESAWTRLEGQARGSLRELDKDLSQVGRAKDELSASAAALEERRAAAAAAREVAQLAEDDARAKRRRQSELSDETVRLHSDMAGTRARAQALEEQGGQNPYWTGAQAVLQAGLPGVVGTVRQLLRVDDAHRQALEDALGERLYAVVCEDSTAARAAVELLEASGRGRARFLVLSSLPGHFTDRQLPEEARPLLSRVQYEPAHEKVVRFLLNESYELGRVLYGDHWVYGGSDPNPGETRLSLADFDELRGRLTGLSARGDALAAEKTALEAEISAADEAARRAAGAAMEEAAREKALASQIQSLEAALALHERNAAISTEESARLLAELSLRQEEIHVLRASIAEAEGHEASARAAEQEALGGLSVLKEEAAKGEATRQLLRSKVHALEDKIGMLAGAYERLAQEQSALAQSRERRREEQEQLARRKEECLAVRAESEEKLSSFRGELGILENEAKGVFERLHELEQEIARKDSLLRGLKTACDELQAHLHQLEVRASSLRATQDSIKTRLWDEWQLTHEEARAKHAGQEVDAEKIEFLRRRIGQLGNVNMAAPEEYEALTQRQGFLAQQLTDLTQAKDDLRAAIQKINGATRENFRQTFVEVQAHFRKLYGVLFEGGEADLVLTDPENILETGVEIVAQPPGKRLQSITLLSGGEKTLTAIALLFAFFMVKPSPFCMLDEADAALDDANIERFVSLLKEFQSRSQFLIVSHNKRTMEAADVMYGVTMEELGISQLISVDFRGGKKTPAAKAVPEGAGAAASHAIGLPPAEEPAKPTTQGPFELAGETPETQGA